MTTAGELVFSDYSLNGDRLWLNVQTMSVRRGWSPSQYNPLEQLGELPDTAKQDILKHLDAIEKVLSEAYTNWLI